MAEVKGIGDLLCSLQEKSAVKIAFAALLTVGLLGRKQPGPPRELGKSGGVGKGGVHE